MGSLFRRLISSPPTILGALLVVAGVVFLGYSIGAYFEAVRVAGSPSRVPPPSMAASDRHAAAGNGDARSRASRRRCHRDGRRTAAPTGEPQAVAPRPTLRPINGAMLAPPDPSIYLVPMPSADAEDRPFWGNRPHPGLARHLEIPAIEVDTEVIEGGIIMNQQGEPEWETVPFVALHYRDTAPVGGRGNAVISGHVVTISMGNVFRDLYKLNFGDTVKVETAEGRFTYVVDDLKLVTPSSVKVMVPTTSPTLTLITCGGEFDSRSRSFRPADRYVASGRLGAPSSLLTIRRLDWPGCSGQDDDLTCELSDLEAGMQASAHCKASPLPAPNLGRLTVVERVSFLLEWLISVVEADSGVVFVRADGGTLTTAATVGLSDPVPPADPEALAPGLIVHVQGGDADDLTHDERCGHWLADPAASMALSLPLEIEGRELGLVHVGFRRARQLRDDEARRVGIIVDHIAAALEAARLRARAPLGWPRWSASAPCWTRSTA